MSRGEGARLARVGALVLVSTLALTASFVGLVALASGEVRALRTRLPLYVTATAAVFVASVVAFEEESSRRGRHSLAGAVGAAVATLFVTGLGGEGVIYATANPDAVMEVQLLGYLLSAALMGTGVGYWTWRNWASLLRTTGLGNAL